MNVLGVINRNFLNQNKNDVDVSYKNKENVILSQNNGKENLDSSQRVYLNSIVSFKSIDIDINKLNNLDGLIIGHDSNNHDSNNLDKEHISFEKPLTPKEVPTLDKKKAKEWVELHDKKYNSILNELIFNIKIFSHEHFKYSLDECVEKFKKKFQEFDDINLTLILVEPKKSNKWVADLAHNQLNHLNVQRQRLGNERANRFQNPRSTVNILLFDDASYSGNQITGHLTEVFNKIDKKSNVFIIIPFISNIAINKILSTYKENERIPYVFIKKRLLQLTRFLITI